MTGDDDDDPIVVIGSTDSSDSLSSADHPRLFSVAPSLTVWDFFQSLPGISLEFSSIDRERDIEVFSFSLEVFSELSCCEREDSTDSVIARHEAIQS